jgi:hypothetical protein
MIDLSRHPKLRQLARNLHIPDGGDCLQQLREHAIATVEQMLTDWNVSSVEELRILIADKLSVKIEYIHSDADVNRLAASYGQVMSDFRQLLRAEFLKHDTEGLLVDNPKPGKGGRDYLVVVDARGSRRARSYFTAWHELAHLLLYPRRQAVFEGFRRTPAPEAKLKDPVESAVDHIAGLLAFWEPLFRPALQNAARGGLSLEAVEAASGEIAPGASLQAACLATVRIWEQPLAFVTGAISCKKDGTAPGLRIVNIAANEMAREAGCLLRKHMRIPPGSALARAFNDLFGRQHNAVEDQADWEVSGHGPLTELRWRVQAARRGPLVYGLLTSMGVLLATSQIQAPGQTIIVGPVSN